MTLLYYLDDLLVFAPSDEEARNRLEAVLQRLREHNLKKCHLLWWSVKFLSHIINGDGVLVDPGKVEIIVRMTKKNLMEDDGQRPTVRRVKSFLGMIFYYQHIPNCSSIAKPLFALTVRQKRRGKTGKSFQRPGVFRTLKPADWTDDCDSQVECEKSQSLVKGTHFYGVDR